MKPLKQFFWIVFMGFFILITSCSFKKSPQLIGMFDLAKPVSNYSIGGRVNGLVGTVVLQNKNGDNLNLSTNESFTFATSASVGTTYSVTVLTNPTGQTCTASSNTGTISSANITNVIVTCSSESYTVGGTITGVTGTIVLQNNGVDNLSLTANTNFTFVTSVANGSAYSITVLTQPMGQVCTASSNTGTITTANITNVSITCATSYTVGGTITGLIGTIVLQDNLGDNLSLNANTNFTFVTSIANGSAYSVTVLTQPVSQTCSASTSSGTINAANITTVSITCSSNSFTVGGTITGLIGTVVLQDNLGDNLSTAANGVFTFAASVANGSPYSVTVLTNPVGQTCSPSVNTGTMAAVNVTNVAITCSSNSYTVGGTITGLTGTVVLQDNLGDNLSGVANGGFTFATGLANGSPYSVTVLTNPVGQTCSPTVNTGTMGAGNVTNVAITCSSNSYTVGGSITGLIGTVVLQDNLGDNLTRAANGVFTFATSIVNGSAYSVTVLTNPVGQTCSASTSSGTINAANITNVSVTCSSNSYSVGGTITGLTGTVVLQDNLGDNLSGVANGGFTFATGVANGSPYSVTVLTQPIGQVCTASTNTGTIAAVNITNVSITCTSNNYYVGGSRSGITLGTIVLQNNGGDNLTMGGNGGFTFTTPIANGSAYSVTVLTPPAGQTCTASTNTGTISGADVTTVIIVCVDSVKPIVTTFTTAVTTTTSTTVSITFSGSDAAPSSGGLKYLVNESATVPVAGDFSLTVAPTTYTFANANTVTKNLYAWMIDAAGNVSIALTPRQVAYYIIGTSSYLTGSTTAVFGSTNDVNPTLVRFGNPKDLALDTSGNLLEVGNNHCVRKIVIATGATTTLSGTCTTGFVEGVAGSAKFASPYAVVIDSAGFIYVTDTNNHCIRKVDPTTGTTTTFAGLCLTSGYVEGTGGAARFNMPQGIAIDSSDTIYVSDTINHVIRKITPGGVTTLLAGLNGATGTTEGTGNAARFNTPMGLDVDASGNVYVADWNNHRIRKITPAGATSLLVGNGLGYAEGTGAAALFNKPVSVHVVPSGNIYVSDQNNHRIRKISPEGITMLIAGSGAMGNVDGIGAAAIFQYPSSIVIDSSGIMYLAANDNHRIRIVTCPGAGGCN